MIAADTSSLVAFLEGDSGSDVDLVEDSLHAQILNLPPVVLTEIISDPKLPKQVYKILLGLPILEILPGYWQLALVKEGLRLSVNLLKSELRMPS